MSVLLRRWSEGDAEAFQELAPIVYDELKRLAGYHLSLEAVGHSLQSTALVHEAYLRLAGSTDAQWNGRDHFFAVASRVLRHVLVDHARRRDAVKRDGGMREPLEAALTIPVQPDLDVFALENAMQALERFDPQKARVVEMRFYGGLSVEATAHVLGISTATVKREWAVAKLFLYRAITGEEKQA